MSKFTLDSVSIADNPQYAIVGRSRRFGGGILGWYKDIKVARRKLWGLRLRGCFARIVSAYEAMN